MPLSGTCQQARRSIIILANYNAAFLRSAEEATYCSSTDGGSLEKGAALKLAFPGHQSATCLKTKPNGEILVTVTTQAWRWPGAEGEDDPDERNSAWINYDAYLTTTRASFASDLLRFKSVLQQVQIGQPKRAGE